MITLKNIEKTYSNKKVKFKALNGINLTINKHDFISITGKSGCGKTTLLNIIGCVDADFSGEYIFDGNDVVKMSQAQLTKFRSKNIGYIFQSFYLIPELNILDNVSLPLGYAGVSAAEMKERSMEVLKKVGLQDKSKAKPNELSGGQQQRAAVARAIIAKPKLILADEPTGNLDEANGRIVSELLLTLHEEGSTLILVTHDMQMASLSPAKIILSDGKVEK